VNNQHSFEDLKNNSLFEKKTGLKGVPWNIFRRCKAWLQGGGRHFENLLWNKVSSIAGKIWIINSQRM